MGIHAYSSPIRARTWVVLHFYASDTARLYEAGEEFRSNFLSLNLGAGG